MIQSHHSLVARRRIAGGGGGPASPGTTDLVSWWSFDETSTPTAYADAHSVGPFDLTRTGAAIPTTNCVVGVRAVDFTTNNDRVTNSSFSDTFHQSDFSIGCWVSKDNTGTSAFINQWGSATGTLHYVLWHNGSGKYQFILRNSLDTNFTAESGTDNDLATYKFLVGVRSGDTITLYVDGVAQATTATFSGTENTDAQKLAIGCFNDAQADHRGEVDEPFVFSDALTADEITWLYNSGSGRAYSDL